jgi:hypothetical protein
MTAEGSAGRFCSRSNFKNAHLHAKACCGASVLPQSSFLMPVPWTRCLLGFHGEAFSTTALPHRIDMPVRRRAIFQAGGSEVKHFISLAYRCLSGRMNQKIHNSK